MCSRNFYKRNHSSQGSIHIIYKFKLLINYQLTSQTKLYNQSIGTLCLIIIHCPPNSSAATGPSITGCCSSSDVRSSLTSWLCWRSLAHSTSGRRSNPEPYILVKGSGTTTKQQNNTQQNYLSVTTPPHHLHDNVIREYLVKILTLSFTELKNI